MRVLYISIIFTFIFSTAAQADPGTYYNSIDSNQTCLSLKTALFNLISNDTHLDYGIIDDNYYRTDNKPNENGTGDVLVDRYCSENPTGLDYCSFTGVAGSCANTSFCLCYNKEHVVPKAWFNGRNDFSIKEYTDMHYLWPADSKTNNAKSNFPLGYVKTDSFVSLNGTKIAPPDPVKNNGYNLTKVFEPIDSFKGDFARAYLYFVTRYQDSVSSFKRNAIAANVFSSTSYAGLEPWILQLCVKWHKMDPPSAFELKRNDSVYAIQGNRNPYIDYPNWVEKVFGVDGISSSCVASAVKNNKTVEFIVYPNPVTDDLLQLNIVTVLLEDAVIEVMDILGRPIISRKTNTTNTSIDVSNVPQGMYFLNLIYKDTNNVSTFIKE